MSNRFKIFLSALLVVICASRGYAVDLSAINYNRPVNDLASMLTRQELAETETLLHELKDSTGTQIGVVTLDSLDGGTIEEVSMEIAEKWGLGGAKTDNGILITIAKADRRMRIEVGQGLEGDLPDAYAKRIIDQQMTPAFKAGQYGVGIRLAIDGIIQRTNPSFLAASGRGYEEPVRSTVNKPLSWPAKIFTILFVLFLIFTPIGRTILMAMLLSGLGRGSGRSSGGGRGYSGGGGGFSGGGASGGW